MKIETTLTMLAGFSTQDHPECSTCRKHTTRRSCRRNIFERILSIAYVYPFRCHSCEKRFFKLQWGVRYKKVLGSSPYRHNEESRFPFLSAPSPRATILAPVISIAREQRRRRTLKHSVSSL